MAEEKQGAEEERLANLREKIEGVDEFLRGEVGAWRRNSKIVGTIGGIVAVVIAIYFGILYFVYFKGFFSAIEGFLTPRTLVSTIQDQVIAQLPDLLSSGEGYLLNNASDLLEEGKKEILTQMPLRRKELEDYLLDSGPRLIEDGKAKLLEQLPQMRARAEEYVEENAGTILTKSEEQLLKQIPKARLAIEEQVAKLAAVLFKEIRNHIDEIAPEVIERNEAEIRRAFKKLADPKAVVQFKEDFKALFNQIIDEQVGEQLDTYADILHDVDVNLKELQEPGLTEEQRLERDLITNLKELIFRKFEALRKKVPFKITPPEEAE